MRPLLIALTLAFAPVVLPAQQSPAYAQPLEVGAAAPDFSLPRRHALRRPGKADPSLRFQGQDGGPCVLLQGQDQRLNGPNERVP